VTFDSADPGAHAASGPRCCTGVQAPPRGFDSLEAALDAGGVPADSRNDRAALVDPDGAGPRLFFQKVPGAEDGQEPSASRPPRAAGVPAEGRSDALEAECTRLFALGPRRVRRLEADGIDAVCIVMQDPEDNEFCLD
jgi:hypothetical protein